MVTPVIYEILNDQPLNRHVLLLCDHASNTIPSELGNLGLGTDIINSHLGFDIGAAAVTRYLAQLFNCTALLSKISRLVIDCNRDPKDEFSIPEQSCDTPIMGNHRLSLAQKIERKNTYFTPYHNEIAAQCARRQHESIRPYLIAIHSFTPYLYQKPRPWHIGLLYNQDTRLAASLLQRLETQTSWVVGDNKPYSGLVYNYTLNRHALAAGYPHISIEIRQDLLSDQSSQNQWAHILFDHLTSIMSYMS